MIEYQPQRQCTYYFPEAFPEGTLPVPNVEKTNAAYDGWNVQIDRLFFANGKRTSFHNAYLYKLRYSSHSISGDPWRGATLSADGTNFQSTPEQPIAVSDGFHCSDLITDNGSVDATVKAVQKQALEAIHGWLQGFEPATKRDVRRVPTRVEYERGIMDY